VNPGLSRSGEWERKLSYALDTQASGKRQPVGDRRMPLVPMSPKTCQQHVPRSRDVGYDLVGRSSPT
jgi:hypothetical protein